MPGVPMIFCAETFGIVVPIVAMSRVIMSEIVPDTQLVPRVIDWIDCTPLSPAARLNQISVPITGVGIEDDILYGPRQVKALLAAADQAGVPSRYIEIRSTKGHDAFLVEWPQLERIVQGDVTPLRLGHGPQQGGLAHLSRTGDQQHRNGKVKGGARPAGDVDQLQQ